MYILIGQGAVHDASDSFFSLVHHLLDYQEVIIVFFSFTFFFFLSDWLIKKSNKFWVWIAYQLHQFSTDISTHKYNMQECLLGEPSNFILCDNLFILSK